MDKDPYVKLTFEPGSTDDSSTSNIREKTSVATDAGENAGIVQYFFFNVLAR